MFQFQETEIDGVLLIIPQRFEDERGCFYETYVQEAMAKKGIDFPFLQMNRSVSRKGVLRGLHYQIPPQAKLVSVAKGRVFDVAVDLRQGSPTRGHHVHAVLDDLEGHMLYIPEGFAHGFLVLSEEAVFSYLCSVPYCPEGNRGVRWDDPELAIPWPEKPKLLSKKDGALPFFQEL